MITHAEAFDILLQDARELELFNLEAFILYLFERYGVETAEAYCYFAFKHKAKDSAGQRELNDYIDDFLILTFSFTFSECHNGIHHWGVIYDEMSKNQAPFTRFKEKLRHEKSKPSNTIIPKTGIIQTW